MRFLSFCSGIGAPEVAWSRLGWTPLAFSEIEPFPCAVLAHRFPGVPNLGDMRCISDEKIEAYRPDVVVAGTPCQSFSVAGLRGGMADPRGNLALVFLGLVDRLRPRWVVWENVPGVLSSGGGRDFGSFLGGLGQLGYGWAYRVLDAQYFGVPQRRRRVFVVGCLGNWRSSAAVLFERHCLSGHPAPCREAGTRVAAGLTRGADGSGKSGYAGRRREDDTNIVGCGLGEDGGLARALTASHTATGRLDPNEQTFVAHSLRADGFDASEDGTGRGTPLVPFMGIQGGHQGSGGNKGYFGTNESVPTLDVGTPPGIVVAFDTTQITSTKNFSAPKPGDSCHPLASTAHPPALAFQERGRKGGRNVELQSEVAYSLNAPAGGGRRHENNVMTRTMTVRRLTPREAERLQGFPDDWTLIQFRGKPAADGPRYRAIGNSMAVPVLEWIGRRIEQVEKIGRATQCA